MTIKAIDIAENKKIDLDILMQDLRLRCRDHKKKTNWIFSAKNLVEVIERLDLLGLRWWSGKSRSFGWKIYCHRLFQRAR